MNRARTTRWKPHFFPLGMAFLLVGMAGLLQAAGLVPRLSSWRAELLGVVAVLFFLLQSSGISRAQEGGLISLVLLWVSAGILRIAGLGIFQLYPLFMAFLGCSLVVRYARSWMLGRTRMGATND